MRLEGKAVIAQGGGPTAVINQSLAGAVLEARNFPQITRVYGALNGVSGIINEDFLDLSQETLQNLESVAATPSSALFSTRDKPDEAYCREIFNVFKAHGVRYFFYIGGNDSADTVRIVNDQAELSDYELRAIHVPKTIDNDLTVNDHTPGYGSAARFVAQAFMGINLDNKALPGVHIAVVMGRHAGFLTAAASFAQERPEDGPHLIYLPERPFEIGDFLNDVRGIYERYGRCVVAVSEGIQDLNGHPIITQLVEREKDDHGNVQLSGTGALGDLLVQYVKDKLGIQRVRTDTFGYLQRSIMGCVSDVDQQEARMVGRKAVQFAARDAVNGTVTIHRTGDYVVDYRLTSLAEVAAKTKLMPAQFINARGNGVTEAFKHYALPLLGSSFPSAAVLEAPAVEKILAKHQALDAIATSKDS